MIRMELKRNKDYFWRTVYVTKLLKSFNGEHVTGIVYKVSETADCTHLLGIERSIVKIENIEYNESVKLQAIIPIENYEKAEKEIIDITSGQAKITIKNTKYNKFIEAKK